MSETEKLALPAELESWHKWLSWFSPDLMPIVADLIRKLNPLLGALKGAEAPQNHERQANNHIVALFDAGTLQLGAPRLVHLAMMILLAKRAEQAGGTFLWGVLQSKPNLYQLNKVPELRRLLSMRCFETVDGCHIEQWQHYLAENPVETSEFWLIGEPLTQTNTLPFSQCIYPYYNFWQKTVDVIFTSQHEQRQLSLTLPDESLAKTLLTGQFTKQTLIPIEKNDNRCVYHDKVTFSHPPLITNNGLGVALVLQNKPGILICRNQKGRFKTFLSFWHADERPVSLIRNGSNIGALVTTPEKSRFWNVPQFADLFEKDIENIDVIKHALASDSLLKSAWFNYGHICEFDLLSPNGRLFYISKSNDSNDRDNEIYVGEYDGNIIHFASVNERKIMYAVYKNGCITISDYSRNRAVYTLSVADKDPVIYFSRQKAEHWAVVLGYRVTQKWHWRVKISRSLLLELDTVDVVLPEQWRVIGIIYHFDKIDFSLVLMDKDKRTIGLWNNSIIKELLALTSPSVQHYFDLKNNALAILTAQEEIILYSIEQQKMIFQASYQPRESDHE